MSFFLNGISGLVALPNPILGNTEGLSVGINHRRSMTGEHYTYVSKRNSDKRSFEFTFESVPKGKFVEVQEFFKASGGNVLTITDHKNNNHTVVFLDDNIEFVTTGRGSPSGNVGSRHAVGNFTLKFTEV